MKLSAREDIEVPLDAVFRELSDFPAMEELARHRGAVVTRLDNREPPGPGLVWQVQFRFRGRRREAKITLSDYSPAQRMVFDMVSGGLEINSILEFTALSRTHTRIGINIDLQPKTLSARLMVQSMKLMRGGLEKRFRKRMVTMADTLEARLRSRETS